MKKYALALVLILLAAPALAARGDISTLRTAWAEIKYQETDRDAQIEKFDRLAAQAEVLVKANPDDAGLKAWQGTILSSEAAAINGISALPKLKKAKTLLEYAIAQDDKVENGFAHAVLGALYDRVPGWPIAFGDSDKAEAHLKRALALDPDGIDANFYYGDFLVRHGKYAEAIPVLEKALAAPARAERKLADDGRKGEIKAALDKAHQGIASGKKGGFNN